MLNKREKVELAKLVLDRLSLTSLNQKQTTAGDRDQLRKSTRTGGSFAPPSLAVLRAPSLKML